jgi:hypothetical protein
VSALRLGRLPDGTRDIRILEPAVGRVTTSRLGIRGGGPYVVVGSMASGVSSRVGHEDGRRGKGPKAK